MQLSRCSCLKQCLNTTHIRIFPLRFKEVLPLALRNRVSHKGARAETSGATCLQPMTEMFECFKKNEYDQTLCGKEIAAFKLCSEAAAAKERDAARIRKQGTLVPGSETLTTSQANVLLKRYPQHNPDMPDRWSLKKFK